MLGVLILEIEYGSPTSGSSNLGAGVWYSEPGPESGSLNLALRSWESVSWDPNQESETRRPKLGTRMKESEAGICKYESGI